MRLHVGFALVTAFAVLGAPTRTGHAQVALRVALLRGDDTAVDAASDAVGPSHSVTDDGSLPDDASWSVRSTDVDDVRGEISGNAIGVVEIRLESLAADGTVRDATPWHRAVREGTSARGPFVRLVSDAIDHDAPGVRGRTLLVRLGDRVRVHGRIAGAPDVVSEVPVGRPSSEDGPRAIRHGRMVLHVMRVAPGGAPVVGDTDERARALAREQVAAANEIYAQCAITFGPPDEARVQLHDPPDGTLLAVGDGDGMWAAGGTVRLAIDGRNLPPIALRRGSRPIDSAERIARAARAVGIRARVFANHRTAAGADGSADVLAYGAQSGLARWNVVGATEVQQSVRVGRVALADGIDAFGNQDSAAGTLEERTLLRAVTDDDPGTIDVVVVNRFTRGGRIGEAFVRSDGGSITGAVLIDRTGIAATRDAWTQSHEMGHVLLDEPWHPDNFGPDMPSQLMDSDASAASVAGPKRLTPAECARMRRVSGPESVHPLLTR